MEKIGENRTYAMYVPYVDRADTWPPFPTGWAIAWPSKSCWALKLRPRQAIRVILTELVAFQPPDLAGNSLPRHRRHHPTLLTFREREMIMNIFEQYCGARLTTHAFRIGGCYTSSTTLRRGLRNSATGCRGRSTTTIDCSLETASCSDACRTSAS